jgi:opacity protein-like surface antigen
MILAMSKTLLNTLFAVNASVAFAYVVPPSAYSADGSLLPSTESRALPIPPSSIAQETTQPSTAPMSPELIEKKIDQLESELILLKRSLGLLQKNPKIALPKNGPYVQADIGIQQREFAGENGITNLIFNPGLYGGLGLGYRYDRNFRFAFEYMTMNNSVDRIRPGIPLLVIDPIIGPVGADGAQFSANGNVKLSSYTLNAFYDLNGFGHQRRFRPYVGAGVGMMTSTITGLQPSFFPFIGVNRSLNASNTQPTLNFQSGISYLANRNTEFYLGGMYTYTSTFLFQNTSFGTLMPNGARNWTLKLGARYTF